MGTIDLRSTIVDKTTFRNGMARLGSAVNVVTTVFEGQDYGFTASAVCSVSDTPATLLVCINRASSCFKAFENVGQFCVNTLSPGQEDFSRRFGGGTPMSERFATGDWHRGQSGAPILANAAVSFECELASYVDEATHRILFGRVISVRENEQMGTLLYCNREYLNG
ncbi:flavin reductase [Devosia sp. MC1541]|uniref:flavin reductase n=1 Tax=Devosia sp. MC1541 TaxID=2725264 RepID=UPI00145DCCA1|nr:flavin reductase [Devosia sp. MC1541]